jgi:hypothetical protein
MAEGMAEGMKRFVGKAAVVTGAARGLGRACALRFAREGASVILADVDAEKGRETLAEFEAEGLTASFVETDTSKRADVDPRRRGGGVALRAPRHHRQQRRHRPLDGFPRHERGRLRPRHGHQPERPPVRHAGAGRVMRDQGRGGVIINMSSVNAILAIPGLAAYAMSKGGVNQLTRAAAIALARTASGWSASARAPS